MKINKTKSTTGKYRGIRAGKNHYYINVQKTRLIGLFLSVTIFLYILLTNYIKGI